MRCFFPVLMLGLLIIVLGLFPPKRKITNDDGSLITVTLQCLEVADDGVISHTRKYQAKEVFISDNKIQLVDVTDEFGKKFKKVETKAIQYIIEQ